MFCTSIVRSGLVAFLVVFCMSCAPTANSSEILSGEPNNGLAGKLTHPGIDRSFMRLPSGKLLSSVVVSGKKLTLSKGTGEEFTPAAAEAYKKLRTATQTDRNHKVQWAFMDLDRHSLISSSLSADRKVFGASSSKIYVAGALLDKQRGTLTAKQLQLMANMLVVSSNTAWVELQKQIGKGIPDKGREYIHGFTQALGYEKTRAFQGSWGLIHGNELVATEIVEYLYDLYQNQFVGAETVWKMMYTCRTGTNRGLKYIPTNIYVGAKTGTYDGPTTNPETDLETNPDGTPYKVKIRNHVMTFNVKGRQYGLAILSNDGSDETVALLAGGIIREVL